MGGDTDIRAVAGIAKLSRLGEIFLHQKSVAGREPLLLLNLHRAVKFHNTTGQHLDRYLNQDIVNSVMMVLRCQPAQWDILHAAEDSSTGQMKICPVHSAKWSRVPTICWMLCSGCGAHGENSDMVSLFPRSLACSKGHCAHVCMCVGVYACACTSV